MNDRYKVVGNEQIIKSFFKDFLGLKPAESQLVMTSFRMKKLTENEKNLLKSYHKEVYMTKTFKLNKHNEFDAEISLNKLYELEMPIRACTYNVESTTISYPQSAFVTYIAINKSDEPKVAMSHMQSVIDILSKNILTEDNKSLLAMTNKDWRSERSSCIISNYVDFDIDLEGTTGYEVWKNDSDNIISNIKSLFGSGTFIIICNGGFHIVVPKVHIKENPKDICKKIDFIAKIKEIEYKGSKTYIPLPGTYQYGADNNHIVKYTKI